jgi:RNA polymerase sigma factor for flagellar operon FliA
VDPEHLYLTHRPFIDRTIGAMCQRHHVSTADRDDFVSAAHFHLVKDDYHVWRVFEGRAPIEVYLVAVLRQTFQDWRNARWGRWRPSAAARRLGPVAVLLETLWVRDGLAIDQVIEMMRTNHGVTESPAALHAMASQLPVRPPRTFVPTEEIDEHLKVPSGEDTHVGTVEADRVSHALDGALAHLTVEDRLLLRLRFDDDLPIATLARSRGTDYQTTYRRLTRVLGDVRRSIEASGVSAFDAAQVLARRGLAERDLTEKTERTP